MFTWERDEPLNLGRLILGAGDKIAVTAPAKWQGSRWATIKDHLALVHEPIFGQVVNSSLEIRTSVSIDPERGAAEDRALFTYEALPRATFLVAEVVLDDYRDGENNRPFPRDKTAKGNNLPGKSWDGPLDVFEASLRMIEWLGVGGMGTRGFGRIAIVGQPLTQTYGQEAWQ